MSLTKRFGALGACVESTGAERMRRKEGERGSGRVRREREK